MGRKTAPSQSKEVSVIETRKETPQTRYDRTHTTRIAIKLNNGTDADVLNMLSSVPNKQGYIKQLIRADIAQKSAK